MECLCRSPTSEDCAPACVPDPWCGFVKDDPEVFNTSRHHSPLEVLRLPKSDALSDAFFYLVGGVCPQSSVDILLCTLFPFFMVFVSKWQRGIVRNGSPNRVVRDVALRSEFLLKVVHCRGVALYRASLGG